MHGAPPTTELAPITRRRRFDPLSILAGLVVGGGLLFAVVSGLPIYHSHPPAPPATRETLVSGGVLVYVVDHVAGRGPPSTRAGEIFGGGFFADYEELPLRPVPRAGTAGEWRIELFDPDASGPARRLGFVFAPDTPRPVRVTTARGDEEPRPLTGELVLDTLDWSPPGPHSCEYTLHSDEDGGRCYRGWFTVEW